jgi:acyl-CoA dehydrogenase
MPAGSLADTLSWPFFDDGHRRFAADLSAFAAARLPQLPQPEADVDAAARARVAALAEAGILRTAVAEDSPAARLDVRRLCLAREILAYADPLADFAFAMQGLGSGPIALFGTAELRARYLPRVAAGRAIAAFALSEPEAGSDVAALSMTATPEGPAHMRLDGTKTFISNGGIADFYVVFARSGEAPGAKGLSAFVVDADTPGRSVVERIATLAPHPLATLHFAGVRVALSQRLGAPGDGFKVAMATLDVFRPTVGAAALGMARRALAEALAHAASRHLFGAPLGALQLTQAALADSATEIDAAALLVYRAAWRKDSGAPRISREAAMAKLFATEAAQRVIDRAVQLHGGRGVTRGSKVEELYREIRALRIYEGASEVQRIVIARDLLKARDGAAARAAE